MSTGVGVQLFTTKEEMQNVKNGGSTLVAWPFGWTKPENAIFQISVPVDVCDILDTEVRVNVFKISSTLEEQFAKAGETMGEMMGKQLEKVFKELG